MVDMKDAGLLGQGVGGGAMQAEPGQSAEPTSPPRAQQSFTDRMLGEAQAKYDAVKKEETKVARVRKGLDKLAELSDAVTSDDVLDEMALLVAKGADPKVFAAMMAGNAQEGIPPMPPQGEPLAKWLATIDADMIGPYEAKLKQAVALAGHRLGVAAMHKMVDAHAQAAQQAPQGAAPASALMAPQGVASPSASPLAPSSSLLH